MKQAQENTKDEPPLPEEDVNKFFKQMVPPRLHPMVVAVQLNIYFMFQINLTFFSRKVQISVFLPNNNELR